MLIAAPAFSSVRRDIPNLLFLTDITGPSLFIHRFPYRGKSMADSDLSPDSLAGGAAALLPINPTCLIIFAHPTISAITN
jgi:hypothetical protein